MQTKYCKFTSFKLQSLLSLVALMAYMRIMYWVMKKELTHTTTFPELAKDLGCSYLSNIKVGN